MRNKRYQPFAGVRLRLEPFADRHTAHGVQQVDRQVSEHRTLPGRSLERHDSQPAQSFDELGQWGARLDPKANEIPLGDDAAVLTAQAPDHDHPAWTLHHVTHCDGLARLALL